jgi:hypothetical protein
MENIVRPVMAVCVLNMYGDFALVISPKQDSPTIYTLHYGTTCVGYTQILCQFKNLEPSWI